MSTIEDFRNAPVGATAICTIIGQTAMKVEEPEQTWVIPSGIHLSNLSMEFWGFELMSAREALDLAWELAHPVKKGQVIPEGTRYLEVTRSGLRERTAVIDNTIKPRLAPSVRTLEPLPDPEPDWLDAPAVLATCGYCEKKALHVPFEGRSRWECAECQNTTTWRALTDVTPLYPKEGQEA